jgi:NAD(P)H dehydrogenase (quinone)
MNYLVLYAHPVADSFQAAVHRCVVQTLLQAGHHVDDCDLYEEEFQPVLSRAERIAYHNVGANRALVPDYIERLLRCEGLVFVFPTWWYGMPAILKGYIDRVWLPGIAFEVVDGRTRPLLGHITRYAAVTTYGSPWWLNNLILGNPNRRVLMRGMRHLVSRRAQTLWLAQYNMDRAGERQRKRFLGKIVRRLARF